MAEPEEKLSFILILLFSLLFIVLYFIYLYLVLKYIFQKFREKRLYKYWIQYIITCLIGVLFIFIYLCFLMKTKGNRIQIFLSEESSTFLVLITIFLIANIYMIINNSIYDSISSFLLSFNLYKMINLISLDLQELCLKIKHIKTNIFNTKQYILFWAIFGVIDIILIIIFESEYINYDDINKANILKIKNFILCFLKYGYFICFIALIAGFFTMHFSRRRFRLKTYYNKDKFAMKIYEIKACQIIYNSDIIIFKMIAGFLINSIIISFLICKICNGFFLILFEIVLFLYILILGGLYFKIDKINDVGKIPKNIKYWFNLKNLSFIFGINDHQTYINENTYKYSKEEKDTLQNLGLEEFDLIFENIKNKENKNRNTKIKSEDIELDINNTYSTEDDNLSLRKTKSKNKIKNKLLKFDTNAELYVLYKLLMLYFEKNEGFYLNVQNKINEDGTPFRQFFTEQNIFKKKKVKSRQTFGGTDAVLRKNNFIANIDRISRISKLNSRSLNSFIKFKENQIFFSLEEKELKEEFKTKFNLSEQETTFKIESLSSDAFFELFPFYQINIRDIKKELNPSDNKKIYNILRNRNNKDNSNQNKNQNKIDKNKTEIESENNLFYTYNSLLMMEVYEPEEFISFDELKKFTLSYGTYLIETIKNINYTFIPLILGAFNIEICDENKVVILYRNPLYFSNFNRFNHWLNFYITEGPEKLKVSVLQNDIIDLNEIEIKNSLKMNEADYEEIINILKNDFNFFMKMNIQVYPIINLFIGDENIGDGLPNNNDANESSLIGRETSNKENNLSGLLNKLDDGGLISNNFNNFNTLNNFNKELDNDNLYGTESNSLVDKEYYSMTGNDIHTLKIYFTHFFRLDCELNKQNDKNDNMILKSNHYCQYLEGQLQTYLTKTSLFELDDIENN